MLGSSIIKLLSHKLSLWLTQKFAPGFHEHLISRTRFIDNLIEECEKNGIESILYQNEFSLIENKTLADLNSVYFNAVDRILAKHQIFNLEHFVVAQKS